MLPVSTLLFATFHFYNQLIIILWFWCIFPFRHLFIFQITGILPMFSSLFLKFCLWHFGVLTIRNGFLHLIWKGDLIFTFFHMGKHHILASFMECIQLCPLIWLATVVTSHFSLLFNCTRAFYSVLLISCHSLCQQYTLKIVAL